MRLNVLPELRSVLIIEVQALLESLRKYSIKYRNNFNRTHSQDLKLDYEKLAPIDKERPELPYDVVEQVNINIKYDGLYRASD